MLFYRHYPGAHHAPAARHLLPPRRPGGGALAGPAGLPGAGRLRRAAAAVPAAGGLDRGARGAAPGGAAPGRAGHPHAPPGFPGIRPGPFLFGSAGGLRGRRAARHAAAGGAAGPSGGGQPGPGRLAQRGPGPPRAGGRGSECPFWLIDRTTQALDAAGLFFRIRGNETQIFRFGLTDQPTMIEPYLNAGYPAVSLEGEYEGLPAGGEEALAASLLAFLGDFGGALPAGIPETWDRPS